MSEPLQTRFPSQGWKQILTARREMLDSFDRAREQARAHEVETFHGKVAEACFRKWLAGFLPKRYGVTPGYVVSPGLGSRDKTPHFDVIVYDQLESPILWIEENPDSSTQGRSLAVPVEHVRAVLEVKSRFTAPSIRDAITHLADLSPLMAGIDEPTVVYKVHLPRSFCCGFVCFDLKRQDAHNDAVLTAATSGAYLRGFFGGVVLRGEGHTLDETGCASLAKSETALHGISTKEIDLLRFGLCPTVELAIGLHLACWFSWAEFGFAQFAFDLIARLQGTFVPGRLSSFYGLGTTQWENALPSGSLPATSGAA